MKNLFLLFAALVTLQACNSDISETKAFIDKVKSGKGMAIEPMPEPVAFKHFEYSAGFTRSPFVAPQQELTLDVISQTRDCLQPDINRTKTLLEAYGLDNLKMRGSLGDSAALWALIETIDGDVHKVKKGHYLGLFHGKILEVTEQQVEIVEIVPDGSGCWIERNNSIALDSDTEDEAGKA